jgi:cell division initiation protein
MNIKWSPMEIQQMTFPVIKKGYDPEEVRAALMALAEQAEYLMREREELKSQTATLSDQVSEFLKRETILKETLLTAQRMSKEIKEQAEREADLIIKEADLKAEKLSQQALQRLSQLEQSIKELRLLRRRYLLDLEQTVTRFGAFLNEEKERQKEANAIITPVMKTAEPR